MKGEITMVGKMFDYRSDECGEEYSLCVDGKVHLSYSRLSAHCGGDDDIHDDRWEIVGPCDGSCHPKEKELETQAEALVKKFLDTGEKDSFLGCHCTFPESHHSEEEVKRWGLESHYPSES